MESGAVISEDEKYRYRLWREFGPDNSELGSMSVSRGTVTFVMLNPSTADATEDDPTIRRCIGYAKAWGYFRLEVVNVYAYRATDPKELPADEQERVGPNYCEHFDIAVAGADLVVCAWGGKVSPETTSLMKDYIRKLTDTEPLCLRQNADGSPAHPLYLPKSLTPVPMV